MHIVLYTWEGVPIVCGSAPLSWPFIYVKPRVGELAAVVMRSAAECDHGGTYEEPDRWGAQLMRDGRQWQWERW